MAFLYTKVNVSNRSLVIVFKLNLKNSGQLDFPGNCDAPKIEHLNLNSEVDFVTSVLNRVAIRKKLSWGGKKICMIQMN